MSQTDVDRLTAALWAIYQGAGEEVEYTDPKGVVRKYWPHRFRQGLKRAEDEGRVAHWAEGLILRGKSDGFRHLYEAGRLDLSAEKVVLDFPALFSPQCIKVATQRLAEHGYDGGQPSPREFLLGVKVASDGTVSLRLA